MNTEQMIKQIDNYINGEDYPDEIPMRIMGLFEREYADLLAEVKRLRGLLKANSCCTACGKYLGQCNDENECIRLGGWTMEEAKEAFE